MHGATKGLRSIPAGRVVCVQGGTASEHRILHLYGRKVRGPMDILKELWESTDTTMTKRPEIGHSLSGRKFICCYQRITTSCFCNGAVRKYAVRRRNVLNDKSDNEVAYHFSSNGHSVQDMMVCGLVFCNETLKRKLIEQKIIAKLGCVPESGMNVDFDFQQLL